MKEVDRRSALGLGLALAAALPAVIAAAPARAQLYRSDEGKQIAPGVRQIDLNQRGSDIAAYTTIASRDLVIQPGTIFRTAASGNDMICICIDGVVDVNEGADRNITAKPGDIWSSGKGNPHNIGNPGGSAATMRIIDLL